MLGVDFNSVCMIQGAASDSLTMVLSIAGAVAFIALILGIFIGTNKEMSYTNEPTEHGMLRTRPLLLPSIAFVLALFLAISLTPHPMAAYHGSNELRIYSYLQEDFTYRVYDSEAYQNSIDIHIVCFLSSGQTLTVRIDFLQNDTLVTRVSVDMVGTSPQSESVVAEQTISIQPGMYEIEVPGSNYHSVTLSQPLVSGFFDEVLAWESYTFFMITGSFFFILLGVCVSTEKKKRYSYERIDQEPPKDGSDYARRT